MDENGVSHESRVAVEPLPGLQAWRERTVHIVLLTILAASVIPLIFILLQVSQVYHDWIPMLAILLVYFFALIPLCAFRRLGYRVRAWGLLLVGYGMAVLGFVRGGLVGEGRLYLLALPPTAIALVGIRAGVVSGIASLLVYAWFFVAGTQGWLDSVMGYEEKLLPLSVWFGSAAGFTMILVAVTVVIGLLVSYLQRALGRARSEAIRGQAILKGIADGVIVFDNHWRVTVVNAAAAELLDRPAEETIGRDIETLMNQGDADLDADGWGAMYDMIETGESTRFEWGGKMFSASLASVREPSGEVIGSVAVLRDVTREAEGQRARDSLFAVTAHELRTPLNAIINFARLMRDGLVPAELHQDTMVRIIANGERLLIMANNLLESAQMAAGQAVLHVESFAPADLIRIVRDVVDVLAQRKGLTLTTHIEDVAPATVTTDRWRLHQVLVNLISNAIKFTDEGRVDVRVYVPDADHWALEVSDTGCGIPPENQARIFEPFVVADDPATRKQAGAGLGLSIVKQLVSLLGGEVELQSTRGQGSVFTVVLPLVAGAKGLGV